MRLLAIALGSLLLAPAPAATKPTPTTHAQAFAGREDPFVAHLQDASCARPSVFAAALADPRAHRIDLPTTRPCTADGVPIRRSYWAAATEFGCARGVSSADGLVRVWTTYLENNKTRGAGFLTWARPSGEVGVFRDRQNVDLHLDGVIDGVYRLSGQDPLYLIVGLRAYLTTYPGNRPRRFAEVVETPAKGPLRQVGQAFQIDDQTRATLLLAAPAPITGKFRHHLLASYWLRYYPGDAALVLELVPGEMTTGRRRSPDRIATWTDGVFKVASGWSNDYITADWQ